MNIIKAFKTTDELYKTKLERLVLCMTVASYVLWPFLIAYLLLAGHGHDTQKLVFLLCFIVLGIPSLIVIHIRVKQLEKELDDSRIRSIFWQELDKVIGILKEDKKHD